MKCSARVSLFFPFRGLPCSTVAFIMFEVLFGIIFSLSVACCGLSIQHYDKSRLESILLMADSYAAGSVLIVIAF